MLKQAKPSFLPTDLCSISDLNRGLRLGESSLGKVTVQEVSPHVTRLEQRKQKWLKRSRTSADP